MGRKPKATKVAEEIANTACYSQPNIPSMEMISPQPEMKTKATGLSATKNTCAIVRRSGRLQNASPPTQNQELEPVVEEINLCESDKEDEPHIEEGLPESMSLERSLEQKINYLVQAVDELKAKAAKKCVQSDNPAADLKYRSLYIDSQKKIEALTSENHELSKKLAVALAKIEAYGEASGVCSEALSKLKDVVLVSNLAKATETAMNLSSQALLSRISSLNDAGEPKAADLNPTSDKRKKCAKGNNNKSNRAKATETAMNLSSQAILGRFSSLNDAGEPEAADLNQTSDKRKKRAKGNNNKSNLAKATETAMNLSPEAILSRFSSLNDAGEREDADLNQTSDKRKKRAKGINNK